jgi:hypothetical protein
MQILCLNLLQKIFQERKFKKVKRKLLRGESLKVVRRGGERMKNFFPSPAQQLQFIL